MHKIGSILIQGAPQKVNGEVQLLLLTTIQYIRSIKKQELVISSMGTSTRSIPYSTNPSWQRRGRRRRICGWDLGFFAQTEDNDAGRILLVHFLVKRT